MFDTVIKTVQPRTGKNHKMFGSRFLKMHNFRDPRWTVRDKCQQYGLLTSLHDKDQKLNDLSMVAETRKRTNQYLSLRQRVKNAREELKTAISGDPVRIQNALHTRKDLQRLYQSMSNDQVIENMKQRTYVKRKELDRMLDRERKLTAKYEYDLLELSRSQDSLKYAQDTPQSDNTASTKMRFELKNTETRMIAVKLITQAYQRIYDTMMRDSLYFDPVMDALDEDLAEQKQFIETTIRLGKPAIANHKKLQSMFERLQAQTEKNILPRLETLKQYRNQIDKNNGDIRNLVRRDSDFMIFIQRYQRNTNSMTQLKQNLEQIEKTMKSVKYVTSCDEAHEVIPRIKQHKRDRLKLKADVNPKERERNDAIERDIHAKVQNEALTHNLTAEEIARDEQLQGLEADIQAELQQQTHLQTNINERNIMLSELKMSFQHTIEVLRHVGQPHTATVNYTNKDLTLPLLNFPTLTAKAVPPEPAEENIETIVKVVKQRVEALMKLYDDNRFKDEREASIRKYHDAVLADLRDEFEDDTQEQQQAPMIVMEDPAVLTRQRLKAMSNRIYAENLKKDEFKK